MKLETLVAWWITGTKRLELTLNTLGKELSWRMVRRAKAKLGKHQPAVGEFPAWAKLSPTTIDEKIRLGLPAPSPLKRSQGWREGGPLRESIEAQYEVSATTLVVDLTSFDDRMKWHELGYRNARTGRDVPPRPVLGPAMYEVVEKSRELIAEAFVGALTPGYLPKLSSDFGAESVFSPVKRRGRR